MPARRITIFLALSLLLAACGEAVPTPDPQALATSVAATLTAAAPPPTFTPAASLTPAPAPTQPPAAGPPAVLVYQDQVLSVYHPQGQALYAYPLPDLGLVSPAAAHLTQPAGTAPALLVYYSDQDGGSLRLHDGTVDSFWAEAPGFVGLAGAFGQGLVAYSLADVTADGTAWESRLFLRSLKEPAGPPLVTLQDERVARPVAVEAANGQALAVWYTLVEPGTPYRPDGRQSGLFRVEADTGQTAAILEPSVAFPEDPASEFTNFFAGLSNDFSWLAFGTEGPNILPATLIWEPVGGPSEASKSVAPDLPEGFAGYAAFSPQNTRLAWVTVHPGTAAGILFYLLHIESVDFSTPGFTQPLTASPLLTPLARDLWPVGWLDEETLLLQGYAAPGFQGPLVMTFGPVSQVMTEGPEAQPIEAQLFAPGTFLGLAPP